MVMKLLTTVAIVFGALVGATSGSVQLQVIPSTTPKNIVFGVLRGGRSHVNWVLSILDELSGRGHNATYAAGYGYAALAGSYESIHSISIPQTAPREEVTGGESHIDWHHIMADFYHTRVSREYTSEFAGFKSIFEEANADVVLCDFFATPCIDAANILNLPLIGTLFIASTPDAVAPYVERDWFLLGEPTTLAMSFASRFYNRYVRTLQTQMLLRKPIQQIKNARRQVHELPFPADPFKNSLKLVNSAFGLEPARPLGPLVEMVGPIVDPKFSPLSPELELYLGRHSHVALVAFGQLYTPTRSDIELIMGALVDNLEMGSLDGFVWAKVGLDIRAFPESIVSSSGKSYNVTSIVGGRHPQLRMDKWVPQQALLRHPSVSVFLSHGGVGSIHESLVSGVPLVVFPLFADQPVNARMVEEIGVGRFMDYRVSRKEASAILESVARDVMGEFRRNVERFGAFVRMRSARGASKGADLVEEVAILHKDGLLPHRYEASRQMSYLKATNLDLDLAMGLLVILMMWSSWRAAVVLKRKLRSGSMKSKTL